MSDYAKSFIPVDDLVKELTPEQVEQLPAFYSLDVVPFMRNATGQELRSRCFLRCEKEHKGDDRSLTINVGHPAKRWYCHGCNKGGNFVALCHTAKTGEFAAKVKGQAFKTIAADIRSMAETVLDAPKVDTKKESDSATATVRMCAECTRANIREALFCYGCGNRLPKDETHVNLTPKAKPKIDDEALVCNVPLHASDNERARALVDLDRKFICDPNKLPPNVSAVVRRLPLLKPEVCDAWRMGYLPRDGGEDRSGGTMRGLWVFGLNSTDRELLTWFGWDPDWRETHETWLQSNRKEREPTEYRFVKGFHWGSELFGQERIANAAGTPQENLRRFGLFVVQHPLEAVFLASKFEMATVATCGHPLVRTQAKKAAELTRMHGNGVMHLIGDCTEAGENWLKQGLGFAAQAGPVSLPLTSKQYGEAFAGRALLSVTRDEWEQTIAAHLRGVQSSSR